MGRLFDRAKDWCIRTFAIPLARRAGYNIEVKETDDGVVEFDITVPNRKGALMVLKAFDKAISKGQRNG